MRGSVVRRRDKFYVVVDLPPGLDGKRRQKWHSGYPSKKQAQLALAELVVAVSGGTYVEPTKTTLERYLREDWLPASAVRVRPNTLKGYRQVLENYVIPTLGRRPLEDLTPLMLTKLYGQLLQTPKQRQPGLLSPRSVRFTHVVLKRALADAVGWQLLARNPAEGAQPPTAAASRAPEMKTWTLPQLQRFLTATQDDRDHVGYLLAATAGLRRGEVGGLRWSDLVLEPEVGSAHLRVRQQLVVVDGRSAFTVPKTAASRRLVALDDNTVRALQRHRRAQRRERFALGPGYQDDDLVICRQDGSPVNPTDWVAVFFKHVRALGLPHLRFHDLRHTHATLALQAGVHPKIMSERLGHTSTSLPLDVYSHALPSLQSDAAALIGRLVFG